MTIIQMIILSLIQGITEFLPISSSGHLILLPLLTGWQDQGAFLDVAAHIGTLAAVLLYFRQDTAGLFYAALGSFGVKPARQKIAEGPYISLFWTLVVATLPAIGIGLILSKTGVYQLMRTPEVIAAAFILFGLALYWADQKGASTRSMKKVGMKTALQMGLAQAFALIPGASRAGVTMTAARALGFDRVSAARFSMLMSIPVIIASGVLVAIDTMQNSASGVMTDGIIVMVLSFIFALCGIRFLMIWLSKASMTLFVIYRILFGVGLFALIAGGYM